MGSSNNNLKMVKNKALGREYNIIIQDRPD